MTLDSVTQAVANVDIGGFKIINAGTPTNSSDLITKSYADSAYQGSGVTLD